MNASFLRREWGAVTFVLTVLLGIIIVPAALYFGHAGTAAGSSVPPPIATASPSASATASPSAAASPSPSPSHSP